MCVSSQDCDCLQRTEMESQPFLHVSTVVPVCLDLHTEWSAFSGTHPQNSWRNRPTGSLLRTLCPKYASQWAVSGERAKKPMWFSWNSTSNYGSSLPLKTLIRSLSEIWGGRSLSYRKNNWFSTINGIWSHVDVTKETSEEHPIGKPRR